MNNNEKILFTENQRFTQWWMWLFILIPFGIGCYGIAKQVIGGVVLGNKPMSDLGMIVFTIFGVLFALFFWFNQLKTTLTSKGIYIQFFPYTKRFVSWENIEKIQVLPYDFVGGWGVRLWTKYGTVYNVKYGEGLWIHDRNKNKFLVGTQQSKALLQILTKHCPQLIEDDESND